MSTSVLVMGGAVFLVAAAMWLGVRDIMGSSQRAPSAHAKVLGNCGDTMQLELVILGNRVTKVGYDSDGCGVSLRCIEAAAQLCRGKTLEEIKTINMMNIMELTGTLADDHLHCAQLAETTIHYALKSHGTGRSEIATGL